MPASDRPVLILGGTAEAVKLASALVAMGYRTISSLAGRTSNPGKIEGEVRIGGFGGADGLADYLRRENIALLVDATHPFATQISDNALAAADATGIPFVRLERPDWQRKPGDSWTSVTSIEDAVSAIPSKARILLALGRQHIAPFSRRHDVHFVVRMIDPPEAPLDLFDFELELSRPGKKDDEAAFLTRKRLTHIVCRNSGGGASYAKIAAARELGLPVIMIERPYRPASHTLPDTPGVLQFVEETLR
ncbi:cobalt-precorrin-6A reductase [Phyllobacterium myrsinacearum]|uniref:Precorrin-6A/cobalt-precorrin-6A reductase n=1 Tax=Phyllobacterium myrsinacearum TaxID=28101 RepID=A0A839EM42_9HYPH|nr:cobalt-precorrin-6A reductase [Phyllobacterium myrsinacearum]MBA8878564.1 precorrin-6A/cobalt-precorrin-6A reductase [Phyllobacterium myrsinacearum]